MTDTSEKMVQTVLSTIIYIHQSQNKLNNNMQKHQIIVPTPQKIILMIYNKAYYQC